MGVFPPSWPIPSCPVVEPEGLKGLVATQTATLSPKPTDSTEQIMDRWDLDHRMRLTRGSDGADRIRRTAGVFAAKTTEKELSRVKMI